MTVTLLPAWKNVVQAIEAGRWTYGDLITHEELWDLLILPEPKGSATVDEYKSWRFRVLSEVDALKDHLLRECRMALKSEQGVGYRILLPSDQTREAEAELTKEIAKAFKTAGLRIRHVNRELLSSDQNRENTDAAVRLAAKRDALRKVSRLPMETLRLPSKPKRGKRQ